MAPRDEPPFIELWIPIVRAMRVELTMACRDLANALTSPVRHAIERQWLQDIVTWGEQAATEAFRTFEPDAPEKADAATMTARARGGATVGVTKVRAARVPKTHRRDRRGACRHAISNSSIGICSDGLSTLFKSYPVLARQLATMAQTGVEAAREFIVRLDADRDGDRRDVRGRTRSRLARCGRSWLVGSASWPAPRDRAAASPAD